MDPGFVYASSLNDLKIGSGNVAAMTEHKPKPPFPEQSQKRPGIEADITPRPQYEAPLYKGSGKLDGKTFLITGGDSGIGRSVAVLFAREGARGAIVFLPEEEEDALETRAAVEKEGSELLLLQGDLKESAFCDSCVDQTVDHFGGLDILVNNAAYQHERHSFEEVTDEELENTFQTNIFAYFRCSRAALRVMQKGSVIINTGSITGLEGHKKLIDYSSTKGAIHAFTKSLALQQAEKGIRVNCVAPGPVWTPLNVADRSPEEVAKFGAHTMFGRPAQPEEIAPAYVFFASEADSGFISGEVLTILGGETRAG